MAFPPATLPVNRTNATPQVDTHPNDHNAIAAAINDTVGRVQAHDGSIGLLNAQVADLFARKARVFQTANTAVIPTGVQTWTQYGAGQFSLDTYTWNMLVSVSCEVGSSGGGFCRLIGGLNGTMHGEGEATAVSANGTTLWLSHTFATQLGPGSYSVEAFALTQNGGSMGHAVMTVVAAVA